MLNLVLADAEVELIPESIASHPSVRATSRRRNKRATECLLDSSLHYAAMRSLPEGGRRGRADIAHFCLLLALDSIPCREGRLRVFVHTRANTVMEFSRSVRLPKNYNRFQGLMESVLTSGSIRGDSSDIIHVTAETLSDLLKRLDARNVLLTERGTTVGDMPFLDNTTTVIGGFPHGDFISDLSGLDYEEMSLYPGGLMAWTAVAIITSSFMPGKH